MRFRFGDFALDSDSRELLRHGEPLHLSPKAFDLLVKLTEASPRALAKGEILEVVWRGTFVSEGTIAAVVAELRAALGDDAQQPRFIRTVFGFGYAFCGELVTSFIAKDEMSCRLVWGEREIPLHAGDNILGRSQDSVAWIDDPSISRHHARISIFPGRVTVEDLGSKNGTFVADQRIADEHTLRDGDRVTFGRVRMIFRVFVNGAPTESVRSE